MIVVGIETSTPQTSVALGTEQEILASLSVAGRARQESVTPALQQLLAWTGVDLAQIGGVAVGVGPGLFTGLRVGVETAKTLAQVLRLPIVGICGLDALAYAHRHTHKRIAAVIDARRRRGVLRDLPRGARRAWCARPSPAVGAPDRLSAELEAVAGDVLAVGNGAMLYRHELEELGPRVEIGTSISAHPRGGRAGRARRAPVPA